MSRADSISCAYNVQHLSLADTCLSRPLFPPLLPTCTAAQAPPYPTTRPDLCLIEQLTDQVKPYVLSMVVFTTFLGSKGM